MNTLKEELRQKLLIERKSLLREERQHKSAVITDQLKGAVDWAKVSNVHIFESIDSLGEVETKPFIDYLKKTRPELKIYHPRKIGSSWHDMDENNNQADYVTFDVIIVPTLGFDNSLNRLGHGGGHYDKFLSRQKSAQTIGLCFELGHEQLIPIEPFDIPLDCIISEKKAYRKN